MAPQAEKVQPFRTSSGTAGCFCRVYPSNPHSPFPLSPALGAYFAVSWDFEAGERASTDGTSTQGGALRRLPWARIRSPFRAKTGLGQGLQMPRCPARDIWVRRGLLKIPADWHWSSWRFCHLNDTSALVMDRV